MNGVFVEKEFNGKRTLKVAKKKSTSTEAQLTFNEVMEKF